MDNQEYKQDVDALAQEMAEYRIENGGWTYSKEIREAYLGHFVKWFDVAVGSFGCLHDAVDRIIRDVQALEGQKVFAYHVARYNEAKEKQRGGLA